MTKAINAKSRKEYTRFDFCDKFNIFLFVFLNYNIKKGLVKLSF